MSCRFNKSTTTSWAIDAPTVILARDEDPSSKAAPKTTGEEQLDFATPISHIIKTRLLRSRTLAGDGVPSRDEIAVKAIALLKEVMSIRETAAKL